MTVLSQEQLNNLLTKNNETCISIYLPVHQAGSEIQQDPIRFKNALSTAQDALIKRGWQDTDALELLKPTQELEQPEFWRHQNEGLAIFITPNFFQYYRLPLNFEEQVIVSDCFYLKPLIPLFTNNGHFYLLALSQNQIRFFQGSHYSLSEIELPEDVPTSLAEALKYDDPEEQLQMHTSNPQGQSLVYHGQGVGNTDNKNQILRFFQKVDSGLNPILNNEQAPLVLAGVQFLLPIYHEASSYSHILEEGVTGNPENVSPEELHQQAWQIIEPYFKQDQHEAITQYQELAGNQTGQTSQDLHDVVKAAYYKRIDSLFVALQEKQWGQFHPETNEIDLHQEPQPQDQDLLNFAAVHTLLNGGKVYTGSPENLPDRALVTATFRY